LHSSVAWPEAVAPPLRPRACALRVVGQRRQGLEAAEAVESLRLVVDGTEDVGGLADVLDGQLVVDLLRRFVLPGEAAQLRVVVVAATDGLVEDRGIRGQAAQIVLVD